MCYDYGHLDGYHGILYIISNLPKVAIWRSKDFRIHPHIAEKSTKLLFNGTLGHTVCKVKRAPEMINGKSLGPAKYNLEFSQLQIWPSHSFSVPVVFILKCLQPSQATQRHFFYFPHIHIWKQISNFYYLRAKYGKMEFDQLQNLLGQMNINPWDIQTEPFAAHSAPFVLKCFKLFHLHTGELFLITPEGQ